MKIIEAPHRIEGAPLADARAHDPVVIAIVGYRNAEDIHSCLSALTRLTDTNFVVSICENGGAAAYTALTERLAGLVEFSATPPPLIEKRIAAACSGRLPGDQPVHIYCATGNLGYAGGINVSIAQLAKAEPWSALWILNPDTEPAPEALTALKARARAGYSLVGGRVVFKHTLRVQSYGGYWRPLMASARNIGMLAPLHAVPDVAALERQMNYVSGASLYATREAAQDIGLLDERYFLYCEEIDWIFRRGAHRLGYAHDALIYHAHGTTMGSNPNRRARSELSVYLDERNRHLFTRRFYPLLYPAVAVTTLIFTLQYVKAGAFHNFLVALAGWFAGVRGEQGLPKRFAEGGPAS